MSHTWKQVHLRIDATLLSRFDALATHFTGKGMKQADLINFALQAGITSLERDDAAKVAVDAVELIQRESDEAAADPGEIRITLTITNEEYATHVMAAAKLAGCRDAADLTATSLAHSVETILKAVRDQAPAMGITFPKTNRTTGRHVEH